MDNILNVLLIINMIILSVNIILYIPHFRRRYYRYLIFVEKKIYNNVISYLNYLSKQKIIPTRGKKPLTETQKSWNGFIPSFGDEVAVLNLNSNLNIGNIYRSCCCLGIKKYHILGKKIYLPSSQVGYDFIPIEYHDVFPKLRDRNNKETLLTFDKKKLDEFLSKKEYSIYIVEQGGIDISTTKLTKTKNNLIIFGNETFGVPDNFQEYLISKYKAKVISVPQFGIGKSLNVSNCASIVLYEFQKQHTIKIKEMV